MFSMNLVNLRKYYKMKGKRLANRAIQISVSLAILPSSCASTANAIVGGWPSVCFNPVLFPKVPSDKQRIS